MITKVIASVILVLGAVGSGIAAFHFWRSPSNSEIMALVLEAANELGPIQDFGNPDPLDDRILADQFIVSAVVQESIPLDNFMGQELKFNLFNKVQNFSVGSANITFPATVLVTTYANPAAWEQATITPGPNETIVVLLPALETKLKLDSQLSDPPAIEKELSPWLELMIDVSMLGVANEIDKLFSTHGATENLMAATDAFLNIQGNEAFKDGLLSGLILNFADFDSSETARITGLAEVMGKEKVCHYRLLDQFTQAQIEELLTRLVNSDPGIRWNRHTVEVQIMDSELCG